MNNILRGIDKDIAEKIYSDQKYGMDSIEKLYYWMQMIVYEKDPSYK